MNTRAVSCLVILWAATGCDGGPSAAEKKVIAERAMKRTLALALESKECRNIAEEIQGLRRVQKGLAWKGTPSGGGLGGFARGMGNAAGADVARRQQAQYEKIIEGKQYVLDLARHGQAFLMMTPQEQAYTSEYFPEFARKANRANHPIVNLGPPEGALRYDEAAGALSVREAIASKDEEVVVVGRVVGVGAFRGLIDASIDHCEPQRCRTPWDYCCVPRKVVSDSMIVFNARGPNGRRVGMGLGFRPLDLVVVKGALTKDRSGRVVLNATGWFRQERPELPDDLDWPK